MMKPSRLFSLCALAFAALLPLSRAAETHVQASLVAADASIQTGQPFTVALRFVHDPHWHTYWFNPGTGLPTSLASRPALPPARSSGPRPVS